MYETKTSWGLNDKSGKQDILCVLAITIFAPGKTFLPGCTN